MTDMPIVEIVGRVSQADKISRVESYLRDKKIAVAKSKICADLGFSRPQIDRFCRDLQKRKIIGFYYQKYWGIK